MNPAASDPLTLLKSSKKALLAALTDAGATIKHDSLSHCRCFLHDETNGSLSVFPGKNSAWAWYCHTCDIGGTVIDVLVHAENLDSPEAVHAAVERYGPLADDDLQTQPQPVTEKPRESFSSLEAALEILSRRYNATITRVDIYTTANEIPLMVVLRFENAHGKSYRPIHLADGTWALGDPPGLLPLFNLVGIAKNPAANVVVVEGEKCAQRLIDDGYVATTSAHGAGSARKTDWSLLAGRNVTVWPDNDPAGLKYGDEVVAILNGLIPRANVKLIDPKKLPIILPVGGDVVDYLEARKK